MPDLTPDERQSLREWLEHPVTKRFMEAMSVNVDTECASMRSHLRNAQPINAAGAEGAMGAYESALYWPTAQLAVKPRRAEASE